MSQRFVCLILLPCVLLARSAAFGHVHGGGQPVGHALRPHMHTKSGSPQQHSHNHHGHHHGADGNHHHHHVSDSSQGDAKSQQDGQPEPASGNDHDSDAVFVDSVDVVLSERCASGRELSASNDWIDSVLPLLSGTFADSQHGQEVVRWMHSPPPDHGACPLFIQQAALLI